MDEEKETPKFFYLYIHSKLAEHSTNYIISKRDAISYLHEWRLPKVLRVLIIRELEILGLLEKQSKNLLKIKRPEINFSEININHLYSQLGILPLED